MANFVNTTFENPSYIVAFNSLDKVSGLNNCATFQINWDDFLPREIQKYKVTYSFQTAGGYYLDNTAGGVTYSSALIYVNWGGRSFSFDTTTKGSTQFLGTIQRDIQVAGTGGTTSASNNLSTYYLANAPRTISRPNQNFITISIYNTSLLTTTANPYTKPNTGTAATSPIGFVTTNNTGVAQNDMTNWVMLVEFIPLYDEIVKTQGTPF